MAMVEWKPSQICWLVVIDFVCGDRELVSKSFSHERLKKSENICKKTETNLKINAKHDRYPETYLSTTLSLPRNELDRPLRRA